MQNVAIISMCYFMCYHTVSLSLSWFGRYRQIYKKIYINIFLKKMTVTQDHALQIAQNQENLRENIP